MIDTTHVQRMTNNVITSYVDRTHDICFFAEVMAFEALCFIEPLLGA